MLSSIAAAVSRSPAPAAARVAVAATTASRSVLITSVATRRTVTSSPDAVPADGLVVGRLPSGALSESARNLDAQSDGALSAQVEAVASLGLDSEVVVSSGSGCLPTRMAIVTVKGESDDDVTEEAVRQAAGRGIALLRGDEQHQVHRALVDDMGHAQAAAEGAILANFAMWDFKFKSVDEAKDGRLKVSPIFENDAFHRGVKIGKAQNWARKLKETPGNLLPPGKFASDARDMLSRYGVDVTIRNEKFCKAKRMGALLSVARGSSEGAYLMEAHYTGAPNSTAPRLALVGKGVTFDTGGISLKPSAKMAEMKMDMGGAATVVAALHAIAALKVPVNVTVVTPLVENMPDGSATKPGDVVTAMDGTTIEVDNTDAEGRLILADALLYTQEMDNIGPIIDVATLTGAMMVALGDAATGVFCNNDALWAEIEACGAETGETMWRMPLHEEYKKHLKSRVADLINVGPAAGGACTAAAFLNEFVSSDQWAHMDIAGVMSADGKKPYLAQGASGIPVRTLVELAMRRAEY